MSNSIGFAQSARSSGPSLPDAAPISTPSEPLQTPLNNSYPAARSAMNHEVGPEHDGVVPNVAANDQRALSNQAIIGLGASSLKHHVPQKQVHYAIFH